MKISKLLITLLLAFASSVSTAQQLPVWTEPSPTAIQSSQYAFNGTLAAKVAFILQNNPELITGNFIIADKANAEIHVVSQHGEILASSKALFGKDVSDKLDIAAYNGLKPFNAKSTPAGIFKTTKMNSPKYGGTILAFIEGDKVLTAFHRVYTGNPAQHRDKRIMSDSPSERRITNGCINVPVEFFDANLEALPNGTFVFILPETVKNPKQFSDYLTIRKDA